MYIILVYDLKSKRTNKMHKKCSQYLHWKQNSVFEGEITKSKYKKLKNWINNYVEDDETVLIYSIRTKDALNIDMIGEDKDTKTIL